MLYFPRPDYTTKKEWRHKLYRSLFEVWPFLGHMNTALEGQVSAAIWCTGAEAAAGCSEKETLGHVLGYCPKGELLRNNRHNKVRSSIASTLRNARLEVYEEVHRLGENGSTRSADIIAIKRRNQRSLILHPTVRFEKDDQQANNIND
ncbi:hypothetical protein ANN_23510 [Periplaneta americana]|uniref:Uncharacterized protein n=1 Tax=Periplaneta americana TaxID=6978 RepID=A0ABQ8SLC1_PERAM|nr:hypothetical protein ANN_23510 [Periplaneta americana]